MDNATADKLKNELEKVVALLKENMRKNLSLRISPAIIEDIKVVYQGFSVPMKQLASVKVGQERTLLVQPWNKENVKVIVKSIQLSDIGVNPSITDEGMIILRFPPVTEETKQRLVRKAREEKEQTRIHIRKIREKFIKEINRLFSEKRLSEDEKMKRLKKIQEIIDTFNEKVERLTNERIQQFLSL